MPRYSLLREMAGSIGLAIQLGNQQAATDPALTDRPHRSNFPLVNSKLDLKPLNHMYL